MIRDVRPGLLGHDLGGRVGHREDDRVAVPSSCTSSTSITPGAGEADEHVGALDHVVQRCPALAVGVGVLGDTSP